MAHPQVEVKNLIGTAITLNQLGVVVGVGQTVNISDNNFPSEIRDDIQLSDALANADAVLVVDTVELDTPTSIAYVHPYSP